MEDWTKLLFHSLRSQWNSGNIYFLNNHIIYLFRQLVKLHLILKYKKIYSRENIKQNVDMNYANEVYKNLLKNYVTLNDNEIEFRISKNEVNNGGTDYVSLISKYINGDSTQNFWFDDFCWGHKDGAMNADLLPAYYCQPFRITINIMCSSDILKENEHRLIFPQSDIITSEVQIANAVSSDFFKGIAIGTQQEYAGNINLSDYLKKFRDDYFRRLNVAVYEINKILQEFAPDLTVFDILTEKPFEINQEGIIPMEEIKKINFQKEFLDLKTRQPHLKL